MLYYHVSRYVNKGDLLTKETKNNYDFCEYISNCDVTTYEKVLTCYQHLCSKNTFEITQRKESKWVSEAIFEYIRKTEYIDMPSRIWGVYLSENLESARLFKNEYRRPIINERGEKLIGYIYEVEVPSEAKICVFDMNIYSQADQILQNAIEKETFDELTFLSICSMAREYWNCEMSAYPQREVLVECDITIGEKVF